MGLDISKCVVRDKTDLCAAELFLYSFETNKSKLALFHHFKEYVYDATREVYDMETLRTRHGVVELTRMCSDDLGWEMTGRNAEGNEINFFCRDEDIPIKTEHGKGLRFEEVEYQRKGMKQEFYTNVLSGCWYVVDAPDKSPDDANNFIFTNDLLDECKRYCEPNQRLLNWHLSEKEFVLFDY